MAADVNEKENARKMRICLTSLQPWLCAGFHGDVTKLVTKKRKMRICLTSLQPWVYACFQGNLTKSVTKKPCRVASAQDWAAGLVVVGGAWRLHVEIGRQALVSY
jgi:hypothetical protein